MTFRIPIRRLSGPIERILAELSSNKAHRHTVVIDTISRSMLRAVVKRERVRQIARNTLLVSDCDIMINCSHNLLVIIHPQRSPNSRACRMRQHCSRPTASFTSPQRNVSRSRTFKALRIENRHSNGKSGYITIIVNGIHFLTERMIRIRRRQICSILSVVPNISREAHTKYPSIAHDLSGIVDVIGKYAKADHIIQFTHQEACIG